MDTDFRKRRGLKGFSVNRLIPNVLIPVFFMNCLLLLNM